MRTTVQSGAFGRPVAVSRSRVLLIVCLITAIVVWMDILAPELDQQLFGGTFQRLGWFGQDSPVVSEFYQIPPVPLEEAQRQVAFHIPTPSWLPAGLALKGAHVQSPNWANTFYGPIDPAQFAPYAGFGIGITYGKDATTYSIDGATKQAPLIIHGHSAQYSAGMDSGMLIWEANGLTYNLSYSSLRLTRAEVQQIAESLK